MSDVSNKFSNRAKSIEAIVKKYKALALDIDGTSIRNEPIHAIFGVQTLHDYGIHELSDGTKIDTDWWFSHLGKGHRAVYKIIENDGQRMKREMPNGVVETLDEEAFTHECLTRYAKFLANVTDEDRPNLIRPGISEIIAAFEKAGKPIIAVSGNESGTVLANMRAIGIEKRVKHFISHNTMDELGRNPKPAPDCYLHGADLLKVAPSEMLAIEDSRTGVNAAKGAGVDVIHILYEGQKADSGATLYVNDNQDVRAAFDNRYAKIKVTPVNIMRRTGPAPK